MNIKKLVVTGATVALLLSSATGAFAHHRSTPAPLPETNVSNVGGIDNVSVNVANTGLNYTTGSQSNPILTTFDRPGRGHKDPKDAGVSVTTGNATALQSTTNEINTVVGCGCATGGNTNVNNSGSVENLSVNVANSGLNWTTGGSLNTGDAGAGQNVFNVINTGVGSF